MHTVKYPDERLKTRLGRIDNALAQMPERYKTVQGRLENVQAQLATAKAELGKPFPQEAELKEKSARLAEQSRLWMEQSKELIGRLRSLQDFTYPVGFALDGWDEAGETS